MEAARRAHELTGETGTAPDAAERTDGGSPADGHESDGAMTARAAERMADGVKSPAMRAVLAEATRAAATAIPILVEGESGVGKEWLARAIHRASPRRRKRLVTVNCGAIPEKLVESILFGHERGAFTGATERHVGKFTEADGGTLFLDEIGELPPEAQVKLLRAVQEGEVEPVGARAAKKVDVRIISATNRRLQDEVAAGRFRQDLFYRLGVFPVRVPPLRERREDIAGLARGFVRRFAREEGTRAQDLSEAAIAVLERFDWPGNIRELENAVFRAAILSDRATLEASDFALVVAPIGVRAHDGAAPPQAAGAKPGGEEAAMLSAFEKALTEDEGDGPPRPEGPWIDPFLPTGEMRALSDVEREMIELALIHYGGRMSRIARQLQIGRSTLYRKLREYGIGETGREGTA